MTKRLTAYAQLMRMDKPIGTYLLLWPTLWGVWIAGQGQPPARMLVIFAVGVLVMRSAGCVINDIADRKIDPHVERTKHRPLAAGTIRTIEAVILLLVLLVIALLLAQQLNTLALWLSLPAVILAITYPFMKRFHSLPQAHLGLAFAFGIPMAFAAIRGEVPWVAWLLMAANICWTIAYDTEYAMSDREDDLKIGVKSSAILFGQYDRHIIGALQLAALVFWLIVGGLLGFSLYYYLACGLALLLFSYHQVLIAKRQPGPCFQAFLHNHWVGMTLFLGIVLSYLP